MLSPSTLRVFVSREVADMRKSFDGLSGMCREHLGQEPTSGQVFVFFNRRRDQVKALWWDASGFAIWHKRLEQGRFHCQDRQGPISSIELAMILEGIEVKGARRYRRFQLKESPSGAA
jgi:transposase